MMRCPKAMCRWADRPKLISFHALAARRLLAGCLMAAGPGRPVAAYRDETEKERFNEHQRSPVGRDPQPQYEGEAGVGNGIAERARRNAARKLWKRIGKSALGTECGLQGALNQRNMSLLHRVGFGHMSKASSKGLNHWGAVGSDGGCLMVRFREAPFGYPVVAQVAGRKGVAAVLFVCPLFDGYLIGGAGRRSP